jgi:predicted DNA-binding protein
MARPVAPISIRLDAGTERQLRRLAHATGGTLSSMVREAVAAYGAQHEMQAEKAAPPYERVRHLLGVLERRTDRSERTGQKLRVVLKAKKRARRAR